MLIISIGNTNKNKNAQFISPSPQYTATKYCSAKVSPHYFATFALGVHYNAML